MSTFEQQIAEGHSVKCIAASTGSAIAKVKAALVREGYDLTDIPNEARNRVAAMARSGSTVEAIARETGVRVPAIRRILGLRHITATFDPRPVREPRLPLSGNRTPPDYRVDPWDEPRPRCARPVVEEWPF